MNRKVVYNDCYGGFGLSPLAVKKIYLAKHPGTTLYFYEEEYLDGGCRKMTQVPNDDDSLKKHRSFSVHITTKDLGKEFILDHNDEEEIKKFYSKRHYVSEYDLSEDRTDPDLVKVVEELGEEANGEYSSLAVMDIGNEKYRIEEYDGWESVITPSTEYEWK